LSVHWAGLFKEIRGNKQPSFMQTICDNRRINEKQPNRGYFGQKYQIFLRNERFPPGRFSGIKGRFPSENGLGNRILSGENARSGGDLGGHLVNSTYRSFIPE
jgi:hypothetical protein